jgi:hypothetical protein
MEFWREEDGRGMRKNERKESVFERRNEIKTGR